MAAASISQPDTWRVMLASQQAQRWSVLLGVLFDCDPKEAFNPKSKTKQRSRNQTFLQYLLYHLQSFIGGQQRNELAVAHNRYRGTIAEGTEAIEKATDSDEWEEIIGLISQAVDAFERAYLAMSKRRDERIAGAVGWKAGTLAQRAFLGGDLLAYQRQQRERDTAKEQETVAQGKRLADLRNHKITAAPETNRHPVIAAIINDRNLQQSIGPIVPIEDDLYAGVSLENSLRGGQVGLRLFSAAGKHALERASLALVPILKTLGWATSFSITGVVEHPTRKIYEEVLKGERKRAKPVFTTLIPIHKIKPAERGA